MMSSPDYDLCDSPPTAKSPFVDGAYARRADMYAAVEEYAFGPVPTGDISFEATKVVVRESPLENAVIRRVRCDLTTRGDEDGLVNAESLANAANVETVEGLELVSTLARVGDETRLYPDRIDFRVAVMLIELGLPMEFLDQLGVSVCGGALFASLTNEAHLTPEAFDRLGIDVDLFATSSTLSRGDRVNLLIEHADESGLILKLSHVANGFCDDFVFEYAGGHRVKVQIVSSGLMVGAADVIRSFDLSVCKLAFIRGRVKMTPDAEYCFRNKAILYVRGMSKDPRYSGRLLKYLKRLPGYKLAVDEDAHAAIVFAARLLDSLRLQVGLSRCARCKRAVSLALNSWTKEFPPCDLGVFVSYMVQLEFPVEKAPQSADGRPSTYAFGHRVQGDSFDMYVEVEPLGGTCGRSNVDALCLQAPPVVDLQAMYLAVKIDRTIGGVLRSVRRSDMCACRVRVLDRAQDCLVEDRRFPCVVHRVPEPRPKAPKTLIDALGAMSAIVSQYLFP